MVTGFEELIRPFNEEAGEYFTPQDVVRLMARLIFFLAAYEVGPTTYLVYGGACGTGGMLTVAEETLTQLSIGQGREVPLHLQGHEVNSETNAISKADLILKGEGDGPDIVHYGSTLTKTLSLPESSKLCSPTRPTARGGSPTWNSWAASPASRTRASLWSATATLTIRSSDSQMIFLDNTPSKMNTPSEQATTAIRISEAHNGSSLFSGDAGRAENNIRRWIIRNDCLEAIVALPNRMFYNTGIATYNWVFGNRKATHREGKVQLINAAKRYRPLRKNLGNKNRELSDEDIGSIFDALHSFEETEQSKKCPKEAFGYWKVAAERPLRLIAGLSPERLGSFQDIFRDANEEPQANPADRRGAEFGPGPHREFNCFVSAVTLDATVHGVKRTAKRKTLLKTWLASQDETAELVIEAVHRFPVDPDALIGLYPITIDGNPAIMEYEPETDLRDTVQIPLLEEGG